MQFGPAHAGDENAHAQFFAITLISRVMEQEWRSLLAATNASCYGASRDNLSDHWQVLFRPESGGKAATGTLIILFLTGVPLNLYIIIAILYKRLYTEPTYLLLLNLGIVHLISCFIPILFGIVTGLRGEVWFGNSDHFRCKLCKIIAGYLLVAFAEVFNMVLFSLERLAFFLSPLCYMNSVTYKKVALAVVFIWCMCFGLMIPPILGYGDVSFAFWCGIVFSAPAHQDQAITYLLVCATIPIAYLIIVISSNAWILSIAIKSSWKLKKSQIAPATDNSKVARIMVGNSDQKRAAFRRWMGKILVSRQLRYFQIFCILLLVNVFALFPMFCLVLTASFNKSAVKLGLVIAAQICQLSQVVLYPAIEIAITPEFLNMFVSCCTVCCPKIRYKLIGHMSGKVDKYCWPKIWAKVLERDLVKGYKFTQESRLSTFSTWPSGGSLTSTHL